MAEPILKVKKHVPSGTIILNRPECRNALSRELIDELMQAFDDFHQEKSIRAVILTGSGSAFCAGMDLKEMQETRQLGEQESQQQWHEDAVQYRDLIDKMWRFPKPIIAAVNGPAVAGGAGLVLASDLVIATSEAKFGLPEPKRGIVAGLVAPLLFFRVGGSASAKLLLSADVVDASEAMRLGIFHELVESDDQIWARAHELASHCAQSAPQALQLTKRMLNETIGEHYETLLTAGAAVSATARTTQAAEEGLAAFFEKRPSDWQ